MSHPNSKCGIQWPAKYGHPVEYFDNLIFESETEAYKFGVQIGVIKAISFGFLTAAASRLPAETLHHHGFSRQVMGAGFHGIRPYHVGMVAVMSGLFASQIATHFDFQKAHDRITEQRRREAFFRAEARRRGEF